MIWTTKGFKASAPVSRTRSPKPSAAISRKSVLLPYNIADNALIDLHITYHGRAEVQVMRGMPRACCSQAVIRDAWPRQIQLSLLCQQMHT